ncbi:protein kinase domain-containing protein [Pendulispora albinea]|uniref:Protein kinase n=1 Tax=Pendulispora albinea TaxID=2741071 RepID=A0ABZ2LXD9_9BACT
MELEARKVPSPGAMLAGKYRVDQVLGSGGMGVVVSAFHVHLQDEVAIKLLRADRIVSGRSAERLMREARAARSIRSEHVARVFDVGVLDDGSPYIVMERLRGRDLATLLACDGPLAVEAATDVVLQACEALVEAHALGIVHRDLKPANLFQTHRVDGSSCVKVLDFGVSKMMTRDGDSRVAALSSIASPAPGACAPERLVRRDSSSNEDSLSPVTADTTLETCDLPGNARRGVDGAPFSGRIERARSMVGPVGYLTGTDARLGSPSYMAPEQIASARHVDARADIWSLGTIVYELLAGRAAFAGESLDEVTRSILEDAPVTLRRFRSDVPPALERVIARCLEKSPSNRLPNVATLAHALAPFASRRGRRSLERIVAVMQPEQVRTGTVPAFFAGLARPFAWRRRSMATVAAGAASVVVLSALFVNRWDRDAMDEKSVPVVAVSASAPASPGAATPAPAPIASTAVASPETSSIPTREESALIPAQRAPRTVRAAVPPSRAAAKVAHVSSASPPPSELPPVARAPVAPAPVASSPLAPSELDPGHLFDEPH